MTDIEGEHEIGTELTIDVEMGGERGRTTVDIVEESPNGGYVVEADGTVLGTLRDRAVSSLSGVAEISPHAQYGQMEPWVVYEIEA